MRSDRKLSALALACVLGGCLPPGEPPAGRHLVHDRTLSGVLLSPSEQEGVPSYLLATGELQSVVWQPESGRSVTLADVYHFADATAVATIDGLAQAGPTITDVYIPDPGPTSAFRTDSRGRLLYVAWNLPVPDSTHELFGLWRMDLGSGEAAVLGGADVQPFMSAVALHAPGADRPMIWLQSPGRTQLFTDLSPAGVIGLDTRQRLDWVNALTFIGEDFYCTEIISAPPNFEPMGTNLIRVKAGAEPEVLSSNTGSLGFYPVVGSIVPQLLLTVVSETGAQPFALLDTETLESKTLPAEKGQAEFVSASPSGQLLLFRERIVDATETQTAGYRLFILDWATGAHVTVDAASVGKGIRGDCEWRPGTNDLWCSTLFGGFVIWSPTRGSATVDAELFAYGSVFTPDGRHWFSMEASGPRPTVYVGSADDPHGPRLQVNPQGTETTRYWLLPDGRLLAEAWASSAWRSDIYLIDADAGTSRALGSAGHVVAVGHTRALALLNWQLSRSTGELILIDYQSGSRQVLAPDVYAVAVDRGTYATVPPGTDRLAPGTRVAFLSRNRLESRDDGLWVTELP